jgi:hypothetical protein
VSPRAGEAPSTTAAGRRSAGPLAHARAVVDVVVPLDGAGLFPLLVLDPPALFFGEQSAGCYISATMTVRNVGEADAVVDRVLTVGEGFSVSPLSLPATPGATCAFEEWGKLGTADHDFTLDAELVGGVPSDFTYVAGGVVQEFVYGGPVTVVCRDGVCTP